MKCKCKPSKEYFDAEGMAFNVFNIKCPIHTYSENLKPRARNLILSKEMIQCVLDNRKMVSQDAVDVFNIKFRTNKPVAFIHNARHRYKEL